MSKSPNPQTVSRLAALFPTDAEAVPNSVATSGSPPPGVPPPDPWAGVPPSSGADVHEDASLVRGRPAREESADNRPLPASARLAASVADRVPPGLKAFRVAVDGRVVAAVAVLALLAIVIAGVGWWRSRPQSVAVPSAVAGAPASGFTAASAGPDSVPRPDRSAASASNVLSASNAAAPATVSVHVVGRVAHPGLFALPAGARVDDALKAAGGALPGTDLAALNLARVVSDGEQIPVGVPGATAVPAQPGAAAPAGGKGASATTVVDLNTATAEQLEGLPGIGPVMAANILDWRRQHGRFTSVDQLREIRGIGERRFEELRPRVRV